MQDARVPRRLAAILVADVVGYTRLTGADEEGTIARLRALRHELIDPIIAANRGRVVKRTGDGTIVEFASVVDALRSALEVLRGVAPRNAILPPETRIEFRVGINVGDVVVEDDDLLGDCVNITARLEGIAEPGGICLSEDAYRQVQGKVAAEFADLGEQMLKNVARPVRVYRVVARGAPSREIPAPGPAASDRPSIAVLPFANMSGDPEQDYFADGVVEDIITGLARIKWLSVIARNSSFTYKGKAIDIKQVGRELDVRYVLEGSVRKAALRVRITAQLIEAATGRHLWAERYDRALDDIFALQDEIAMTVLGAIEPSLHQAEMERVRRKRPDNLDAYDLVLRATPYVHRLMPKDADEAIPLLDRAIALEPNYAEAHALRSYCYETRYVRAGFREADRVAAVGHARTAIAVGGDHPWALALSGLVLLLLEHDCATARDAFERAAAVGPSSAIGLTHCAFGHVLLGQAELGMAQARLALRLNPFDPLNYPANQALAYGSFALGRYADAAQAARRAVEVNPGFSTLYTFLVASMMRDGQIAEAKSAAAKLLAVEPGFTIGRLRFIRIPGVADDVKASFVAALAEAGLPE